ncbi:MAG: phosphoglucosamine mutase [Deltaproteobacteria bacterium]|nr:phosphoglucosamine mutase [Deltaproteobacteria bacterium]
MRRLFGTDGIRGIANVYPMTVELAVQVGRGTAYVFKNGKKRHKIVIGKDTRLSGYMIENAIAAGICSMGVDVLLVGPLPTPGIAFITSSMRADAGVVISASHNAFQDNGIKIFSRDGFKLPDSIEEEIEKLISSNSIDALRPTAKEVGKAYRIDDAKGRYIVFLKHTFPMDYTLDGLKIVLDCANGAAYKVAPEVFSELGADVVLAGVSPDGENINDDCGSLHPELIGRMVKEEGADIGLALDGDADRVIFVDENGTLVDGDHIMAICAKAMMEEDRLKERTLVATVMSNMGLEVAMRKMGGKLIRTDVGDRYVVEKMREKGCNLGGEQSGHIVFLDYNTTGDGTLTALQLLSVMKKHDKTLSELTNIMETYPQILINVKVKEKIDFMQAPELASKIEKIEKELGDSGRVLIRYSGTEPLVRIMLEGADEKQINGFAEGLAEDFRKRLG